MKKEKKEKEEQYKRKQYENARTVFLYCFCCL